MYSSSPEEKLLKLIKDATGRKEKRKNEEFPLQKPPQAILKAPISRPQRQPIYAARTIRQVSKIINLESINIILRLGLALVVIIFILDIIWSNANMRRILSATGKAGKEADLNSFSTKLDGDFSRFAANIKTRDIFTAPAKSALESFATGSAAGISQYANKLKLLGTISGEKEQAVIEDTDDQKTYTVSAGDYLKDFLVEEVGSGKVILDYKGEKIELAL